MPGEVSSPIVILDENAENQPARLQEHSGVIHTRQYSQAPPPYQSRGQDGNLDAEPYSPSGESEHAQVVRDYEYVTAKLREALAARAPFFTESEIEIACSYMCSTTRDNLVSLDAEVEVEPLSYKQRSALSLLQSVVAGTDYAIDRIQHGTAPVPAAPVIDVLLVRKVLMSRIQGLVDLIFDTIKYT